MTALAAALVATVGVPAAQASTPPASNSTVQTQDPATEPAEDEAGAPDVVSASVAARATGEPVEVVSARDEYSTTWVNPDGTFTTEASQGKVRFLDEAGEWVDVDLDLSEQSDGSVVTAGHPDDLVVGGNESELVEQEVATVTADEGSVSLGVDEVLGDPDVEGSSATYEGVWPGVDVVVDARRGGFEQTFVVNDAASVAGLPGKKETVTWELPLATDGLTPELVADGSIVFRDGEDTVVSTLVAPEAFDAKMNEESGLPVNTTPVTLDLAKGKAPKETRGKKERPWVVSVSVDRDWLADEDRVFPVVVDPTYASATASSSFDTRAVKGIVTPASGDDELWVGTYNGGTNVARSYVNFATSPFAGKQILSATLSLYETWAWSCTAKPVAVHEANATVDSSTVWTNKPTHNSTAVGTLDAAKRSDGSGDCGKGRIEIPMTSLAQAWSTTTASTKTLLVKAPSETDNFQWKKFHSREGAYPPVIRYTYNRAPSTPTTPNFAAADVNSYTDPATGVVQWWTKASRPTFEASTSDPDGNSSAITFEVHTSSTAPTAGTLVSSCTTGSGTGGTVLSCRVGTTLADGSRLYVRARATDSRGLTSPWSSFRSMWVSRSGPTPPVISCPAPHTEGSWQSSPPSADVTCTITAAGAGTYDRSGYVDVQVDAGTWKRVALTPSSDPNVAKTTVKVPKAAGGHNIRAIGISRALVPSTTTTYGLGYGTAGMSSPVESPRLSTIGRVAIKAAAPPAQTGQTVTGVVRYRLAGTGLPFDDPNWFTDPATVTVSQSAGQSVATAVWDSAAAAVNDDTGAEPRVPVVLDVQVCFTYGGGVTKCTGAQDPTSVFRVPHAFGDGFPTSDVGVGQVALFTGEFNTTTTDVSVPAYAGDLSLSRSHSTYAGPTDATTGVFGPGWAANIDGSDAGLAGAWVVDNTDLDGSIVLIDGDGSAVVFDTPNGLARTGANLAAGTYVPGSEDTDLSGLSLKVSGTGANTKIEVTDIDGTVTTFTTTTAPATNTPGVFAPSTVAEVGVPGVTTYTRDSAGRVTRIVAPTPTGLTCSATGTLVKGCRALTITYATATTATTSTPGDVTGQVKTVSAVLYDPAAAAMATTAVASYKYNSGKRLVSVTDPRTNLATGYTYDGSGRLSGVTPPGKAAVSMAYTGGTGNDPVRVTSLSRGGAQQARFIYGLNPTTSPPSGLPDMRTTDAWGQTAAPTYGAAVFGPDRPITATTPEAVGAGDWPYADVSFTDPAGYTINEATYGAGAWQVEATDYDESGNVVRELDASAVAKSGTFGPLPDGGDPWTPEAIDTLATKTVYNADPVTGTGGVVLAPAGSLVTDTYGPARQSFVPGFGVVEAVRPHTTTVYDQGAPNSGLNTASGTGFNLPTKETTTAADSSGVDMLDGGNPVVLSSTTLDYAPIVSGDGSGWTLGSPTKSTTGGITTVTRFDTEGKTVEERQPSEATTGNGPGTRRSTYYTVGANAADSQCGNKPEWAGLPCRTYPVATIATGIPDERVTGYSMWLIPATVVETSGSATRTTTTTFDTAGRESTVNTATSGLSGSSPVAKTKTVYSTSTGEVTGTQSLNSSETVTASESYAYDSFGRATGYTNELGDTTTTSYDTSGRVASVVDPTGSTTYTYDGTDAAGKTERRGLPTSSSTTFGSRTHVMGGAYDANGTLTKQTFPGGITQTTKTDAAGEPVEMFYNGPVVDPDTGTTGTDTWLGWHVVSDPIGRTTVESTPAGAAFDGSDTPDPGGSGGVGDAYGYERSYTYDGASRLTGVTDKTATGFTGSVTDPDDPAPNTCAKRSYAFDVNSNRTGLTTATCPNTSSSIKTWSYNAGDAATTGANGTGTYVYDAFGRQTTVPAADTAYGSANLTLGYFDTDVPKSIASAGVNTSFTLDVAGRRLNQTTTGLGPLPDGTTPRPSVIRHYTDTSDNPGWVDTGGTLTKYAPSLGGDLGIDMTSGAAHELTLANPHGDVVTTTPIPATGSATGISAWSDYTEYGTPRDTTATATVGGPAGYGWLGTKERATPSETFGLTLMGVRFYNATTGRFTSRDPVFGGNPNTYTYPVDPINMTDLDGKWGCWWCKKAHRAVKKHWKSGALALYSGRHRSRYITRGARATARFGWRHTHVGYGVCAGVCGSLQFQRGHITATWGQPGFSTPGGYIGYSHSRPRSGRSRSWGFGGGAGATGSVSCGTSSRRSWRPRLRKCSGSVGAGAGGWAGPSWSRTWRLRR